MTTRPMAQLTGVSVQSSVSPSSSLLLLLLGHAAHPPLHPTVRGLSLALLTRSIGVHRGGSGGTSPELILLRIIVSIKVDIVTLEVLVLRRKFGSVEVVVDVRVSLFLQRAPVVRTGAVLSKRLVQSGLGH